MVGQCHQMTVLLNKEETQVAPVCGDRQNESSDLMKIPKGLEAMGTHCSAQECKDDEQPLKDDMAY